MLPGITITPGIGGIVNWLATSSSSIFNVRPLMPTLLV